MCQMGSNRFNYFLISYKKEKKNLVLIGMVLFKEKLVAKSKCGFGTLVGNLTEKSYEFVWPNF